MQKLEKLLEAKEYKKAKEELKKINEVDVAEILEDVEEKELIKIFKLIDKDKAADVFSNLSLEKEAELIGLLTDKEAVSLLNEMYADDAADLVEEMPANVVKRLLKKCPQDTRNDINKLLNYPDYSAGSIMTVEFAELKENLTIEKAIEKLRKEKEEYETVNTCFVVNSERKLLGKISLKDIVFSETSNIIKNIYDNNIISIKTTDDQEEVAKVFKKYDLTVMPVVDSEDRLVGIITIDDVVDVLEEETTEDIEIMAAITPTGKSYLKTGVFETWKKRIPWLLLMMISATFTGKIIQHYESALAGYIILTSFIPMLMDTGGNAGSQASVTVIRGLSLSEIEFSDIFRVLWKEFKVAIICGITLAIANFIRLMIVDKIEITVGLIVCLTLFITVIVAKLIGCTLPLLAKKLGFDPAVMASPFITTLVDAISLLTYFQIASHLLNL
ncbi:MAG: magnesium transporter [Candidatus Scatovivens sp.]